MRRSHIQTAYLKANYPVEFLAASMTLDAGSTDRLNIFRQEAQRLGIKRRCRRTSTARNPSLPAMRKRSVIYYALAAVKGVGRQAMDHVVAQREADGPFRSLADFARRVDSKLVNKRAFESLVRAGAFDGLIAQPPAVGGIRRRDPERRRAQHARARDRPVDPVRRHAGGGRASPRADRRLAAA